MARPVRALLRGWRRLWTGGVALVLLVAPTAHGQGFHPLPRETTLRERLGRADLVVLGRVGRVETGRIHVDEVRALLGDAPDAFQVKRSPLRPPPYPSGELAVLFLRGARSPYVLAESPTQAVVLDGDQATLRFADAVRALVAAGDDRQRLLELHLAWLASSDEPLRRLALAALLHPEPALLPLPDDFARERARVALAGDRTPEERQASAFVAAAHPEGLAALLDGLEHAGADVDPGVVRTALLAAAGLRSPRTEQAVLHALRQPEAAVRIAGLQAAGLLRGRASATLRNEVARVASEAAEGPLRTQAEKALRRLGGTDPAEADGS